VVVVDQMCDIAVQETADHVAAQEAMPETEVDLARGV
jgi:hypothetical protein